MSILKILKYPDKRLRRIAQPVNKINKKIQNIINNMFETMYKHQGIGLAATQVNINLKIIVIDKIHPYNDQLVLINPKIIYTYDTTSTIEGCLSLPGINKKIIRSKIIKIQALNYYGKKITLQAESLLSICIQHEIDHLTGKLLIDY
ncbi:peptide deformylase [Buchnera aphidicola]|uniref:Peptide deformylase n=1 Tax=Buchnera aphidicola (Stegophylla sp.) TaxID=2315800 RepID=A0A4D6YKQ8_9GAMM|nr:peptide deformylase [Buchnera aphidicola (Stegophylla sp.)]